MNILFFLTPKIEVEIVYSDFTLLQTLEVLERSNYSAIPIINRRGEYKGTISEGDILWALKNDYNLNLQSASTIKISKIRRRIDNKPVHSTAKMGNLIDRAKNQNFVPVIDDDDVFIGIVKRRDILQYFYEQNIKTAAQ